MFIVTLFFLCIDSIFLWQNDSTHLHIVSRKCEFRFRAVRHSWRCIFSFDSIPISFTFIVFPLCVRGAHHDNNSETGFPGRVSYYVLPLMMTMYYKCVENWSLKADVTTRFFPLILLKTLSHLFFVFVIFLSCLLSLVPPSPLMKQVNCRAVTWLTIYLDKMKWWIYTDGPSHSYS